MQNVSQADRRAPIGRNHVSSSSSSSLRPGQSRWPTCPQPLPQTRRRSGSARSLPASRRARSSPPTAAPTPISRRPGTRRAACSATPHPETPSYPLDGWGYSEVGRVVEVADRCHCAARGVRVAVTWSGASGATRPKGSWPPSACAVTCCPPGSTRSPEPLSASAPSPSTPSWRPTSASGTPSSFRARGHRPARHRLEAERGHGDRRRRHRRRAARLARAMGRGRGPRARDADVASTVPGAHSRTRAPTWPSSSAASTPPCTRPSGASAPTAGSSPPASTRARRRALRLGEEFHHNRVS